MGNKIPGAFVEGVFYTMGVIAVAALVYYTARYFRDLRERVELISTMSEEDPVSPPDISALLEEARQILRETE